MKQFTNAFRVLALLAALAIPTLSQTTSTDFRRYASGEIDSSSTGTHDVYTTLSDLSSFYRNFEPFLAAATVTANTNVLVPAVINIGTNSPNYDNIVSAMSVGSGLLKIRLLTLSADLASIPADTAIKVKITTACVPIPLTTPTCKFRVNVVGAEEFIEK